MSLQRQHFLVSYLNTLSVDPAGALNPRPPEQKPDAQLTWSQITWKLDVIKKQVHSKMAAF